MDSALASIQLSSQPSSVPSAHHRKIELQSYADLTYLQQNLARSARAKLDLHFPPIPTPSKAAAPATVISLDGPTVQSQQNSSESSNANQSGKDLSSVKSNQDDEDIEDPLRARVRHLIDTFLQETNDTARHSISVNGIDASSITPSTKTPNCSNPEPTPQDTSTDADHNNTTTAAPQEIEGIHYTYEPFDPRLQKKLAALHGELESLTAQVSKLRREAPAQAAALYSQNLEDEMKRDDEAWEVEQMRVQEKLQKRSQSSSGMVDIQMSLRDGWNQDVKATYERGVNQLAVLSGVAVTTGQKRQYESGDGMVVEHGVSLTETVGRAQRARNVAMEFE